MSWRPAAFTVCASPGHFRENPKRNNDKQGIRNAVPTIYKISPASAWREAERQGVYKRQCRRPARRLHPLLHRRPGARRRCAKHYFGQTGLFLIAVDVDMLGDALRWERSRNDELFPHLYGELDIGAVTAILDLRARSDGYHDIPELTP